MSNLYDKMTRRWAKAVVLRRDVELGTEEGSPPVLKENFGKGGMAAQIQAIFEAMSQVRLSSNRDRNRMALAMENMKKVRRHVGRLEEQVVVLQEQVVVLEESAPKKGD